MHGIKLRRQQPIEEYIGEYKYDGKISLPNLALFILAGIVQLPPLAGGIEEGGLDGPSPIIQRDNIQRNT